MSSKPLRERVILECAALGANSYYGYSYDAAGLIAASALQDYARYLPTVYPDFRDTFELRLILSPSTSDADFEAFKKTACVSIDVPNTPGGKVVITVHRASLAARALASVRNREDIQPGITLIEFAVDTNWRLKGDAGSDQHREFRKAFPSLDGILAAKQPRGLQRGDIVYVSNSDRRLIIPREQKTHYYDDDLAAEDELERAETEQIIKSLKVATATVSPSASSSSSASPDVNSILANAMVPSRKLPQMMFVVIPSLNPNKDNYEPDAAKAQVELTEAYFKLMKRMTQSFEPSTPPPPEPGSKIAPRPVWYQMSSQRSLRFFTHDASREGLERNPNLLGYTDEFVIVRDKYPKARSHFLILPIQAIDSSAFLCRKDLPMLRRMLVLAHAIVHTVRAVMQGKFVLSHRNFAHDVKRFMGLKKYGTGSSSSNSTKTSGGQASTSSSTSTSSLYFGRAKQDFAEETLPELTTDINSTAYGNLPLICKFLIGFHAIPSMQQLHLHILSEDLDALYMSNKDHWRSYTTPYLVPLPLVIQSLQSTGDPPPVVDSPEACRILKWDIACDGVVYPRLAKLLEYVSARSAKQWELIKSGKWPDKTPSTSSAVSASSSTSSASNSVSTSPSASSQLESKSRDHHLPISSTTASFFSAFLSPSSSSKSASTKPTTSSSSSSSSSASASASASSLASTSAPAPASASASAAASAASPSPFAVDVTALAKNFERVLASEVGSYLWYYEKPQNNKAHVNRQFSNGHGIGASGGEGKLKFMGDSNFQ